MVPIDGLQPVAFIALFLAQGAKACEGHNHHHPRNEHDEAHRTLRASTKDSPVFARGKEWRNFNEWTKSADFRQARSHVQCGTEEPTLREMRAANTATQKWLKEHSCTKGDTRNPHCQPLTTTRQNSDNSPIRIPVKWHSIGLDDGSAVATDQQILDTMDALNQAFAHPTTGGFAFDFDINSDKTETLNSEWHYLDSTDDIEYKSELRQGDCRTLNIYATGTSEGIFGWGSKPHRCEDGYQDCFNRCELEFEDDGAVIRYELVKGGPLEMYNEGDVLVHEVGHWLGLYHTFQNRCESPGDFIFDTAAEDRPALDCKEGRNTCTGSDHSRSGPDPIHNYMNLSNDPCMFEFTDGQFAWMYAQWEYYRVKMGSGTDLVPQSTEKPTDSPTMEPTSTPEPTTGAPTKEPTPNPTPDPTTRAPTKEPTPDPTTNSPTKEPTQSPTTSTPTFDPTSRPTTSYPTKKPTLNPTTDAPALDSTPRPTPSPVTNVSTSKPNAHPTTNTPTLEVTPMPTKNSPTSKQTAAPVPTMTLRPTTASPTSKPTPIQSTDAPSPNQAPDSTPSLLEGPTQQMSSSVSLSIVLPTASPTPAQNGVSFGSVSVFLAPERVPATVASTNSSINRNSTMTETTITTNSSVFYNQTDPTTNSSGVYNQTDPAANKTTDSESPTGSPTNSIEDSNANTNGAEDSSAAGVDGSTISLETVSISIRKRVQSETYSKRQQGQ